MPIVFFVSEDQPHGSPRVRVVLSYGVLEVPLIGEVQKAQVVHEECESGRADPGLCNELDLQLAAAAGRRLVSDRRPLHEFHQLRCLDVLHALFVRSDSHIYRLLHIVT